MCPQGRLRYEHRFAACEPTWQLTRPSGRPRSDVVDLTKRQREIFDFIGKYADKTGYPPTVREIGKAVGLHSSSTVHAHLANLEKIGLLKRDPTKPRAIEVLIDKAKSAVAPNGLPLLGQVAAGSPITSGISMYSST